MIAPSKRLNIVDSSAWLEYFAGGAGAEHFAAAIEAVDRLIVPSICLLEVFKVVLRQRGESDALQAIALMQQGSVVELDSPLALAAAKVGVERKLLPFYYDDRTGKPSSRSNTSTRTSSISSPSQTGLGSDALGLDRGGTPIGWSVDLRCRDGSSSL